MMEPLPPEPERAIVPNHPHQALPEDLVPDDDHEGDRYERAAAIAGVGSSEPLANWEVRIADSDEALSEDERYCIQELDWREERRSFGDGSCVRCLAHKPVRSSGRCYACHKHWQRSLKGGEPEERPWRLIAREMLRDRDKGAEK